MKNYSRYKYVLLQLLLMSRKKIKLFQLSEGCDLIAPDVLPFEIGNALTAMMKKGVLEPDEIMTSWEIIQHIPVELRRIDIKVRIGNCGNV